MVFKKRPGFPREEDNRVTTDPPIDGQEYVRKDGEWAVASGGPASFETVSKNLDSLDATYNYTSGNLTSILYSNGVTKTFNYTGDQLTSVVLSGSTPGGIELTKTFTYSGDDLIEVEYS